MYKAGVPVSAWSGEKVAPGRTEPFEGNLRSGEICSLPAVFTLS